MKSFRSSLVSLSVLLLASAAPLLRAADTADNAYILQLTPAGDQVPTTIIFNSNLAGQDLTVQSTGLLGINPVTKGNITSSVIAAGSATSLTTATTKTVTSLTLGVGVWRVYGYVDYVLAGATTTVFQHGFATTTNTFTNSLQAQDTNTTVESGFTTATQTVTAQPTPFQQITVLSGTQQIFMVANATFSAGTVTAYGSMYALQSK